MSLSEESMDLNEADCLMRERRRRNRIDYMKFFEDLPENCGAWLKRKLCPCIKDRELVARTVRPGVPPIDPKVRYVYNGIRNTKYTVLTFLPGCLFENFKLFVNFFNLVLACTQFIPPLSIGELYTYWCPLLFIIFVSLCREAVDEIRRWQRDREVNLTKYQRLTKDGNYESVCSANIAVGDVIRLEKGSRVPADMVILKSSENLGTCFLKTDQLDGETDWKLKVALAPTQSMVAEVDILRKESHIFAEKPHKDIYSFSGVLTERKSDGTVTDFPVGVENVIWSSTVLATGTILGVVIYTGPDTRSVLNTSKATPKLGRLDLESNFIIKLLFVLTVLLSFALCAILSFIDRWWLFFIRYVILFSNMVPLSLVVNLQMSKIVQSWYVQKDNEMPGTVARNTGIVEELGRVQILLSDKTGTLTQNVMTFKKLHLGSVTFSSDTLLEVRNYLRESLSGSSEDANTGRLKYSIASRVYDAVRAIACCHNVTPTVDDVTGGIVYQASSPDEVALVQWSEEVGLTLVERELNSMTLQLVDGTKYEMKILNIFPFTSENKRMGIIVKEPNGQIVFYLKGADTVMSKIVQYSDWLEEECDNMAREGLRTLVVGRKVLTPDQYRDFESRYNQANLSHENRSAKVRAVVESLERDLDLLCVTGVEDKLQDNIRQTLEALRNAGIRVWMLTGDKLETATCIAKSSRLFSPKTTIHTFREVFSREDSHQELNSLRRRADQCALIISGRSMQNCVTFYEEEFVQLAMLCQAVVICRCSPTQKADIVTLLQKHTKKVVAAIGDGGNDVSMIQAASVGIGIVGKEGLQAALASDFSISQFSHLQRLLFVHGRNSYKSAASLTIFVLHRGLILTCVLLIIFSFFYLCPLLPFPGMLLAGYSTVFTMFPVFSLVLDQDISPEIAMKFPELYKDMTKGRDLSMKRFLVWVLVSLYQACIITYMGIFFTMDKDTVNIAQIIFTSLVATELIMVLMVIRKPHWLMFVSEIVSIIFYIIAVVILNQMAQFGKFLWS